MFAKLFNIFKKEEVSSLTDYSTVAVDMHSHLIPGVDDGVKTVQEAVDIIRQMGELGYRKVITTPHAMADGYNNKPENILPKRDLVREALKAANITVEFDAAAEYYMDERLTENIEKRNLLTMGGNMVLVEVSYVNKPNNLFDVIYKLQCAGYRMILAHPERYPFYNEPAMRQYKEIRERGVLFQINLASLVGRYGPPAKFFAEKMIDENMVDLIGSDLHGARHIGVMQQCLKTKYLEKVVNYEYLMNRNL